MNPLSDSRVVSIYKGEVKDAIEVIANLQQALANLSNTMSLRYQRACGSSKAADSSVGGAYGVTWARLRLLTFVVGVKRQKKSQQPTQD